MPDRLSGSFDAEASISVTGQSRRQHIAPLVSMLPQSCLVSRLISWPKAGYGGHVCVFDCACAILVAPARSIARHRAAIWVALPGGLYHGEMRTLTAGKWPQCGYLGNGEAARLRDAKGSEGAQNMPGPQRITDLAEMVAALPSAERRRFELIFHISSSVGRLNPPLSMHDWIEGHFGSVEAVLKQRIVRVTNLITMEGALFNELRAQRPMVAEKPEELERLITKDLGGPFCQPMEGTPEDVFGRVEGEYSVTASNIAKFDGWSGVVIFDEHDPLALSAERVADYIDSAVQWAHRAREIDEDARYLFFLWNCIWKAGASIVHGHAQVVLGRDMHYAKVEHLRRAALEYRRVSGRDYFDDLYRVHDTLGLSMDVDGVRILAYLSPLKEKEILLISQDLDESLKLSIFRVLDCFVQGLGVTSFNLAIYMPPLAPVDEDWSGFPVLVRILDRGNPMNRTTDMGAMELYASSIISSDPFRVIDVLRDSVAE